VPGVPRAESGAAAARSAFAYRTAVVAAENCHGPASDGWGAHDNIVGTEKSVALGMPDPRDVIHRTEKCLECSGTQKNSWITDDCGGAPATFFERISCSAVMRGHWKVPRESDRATR